MKIFYLIPIFAAFCSCYSYRNIDNNGFQENKYYKVTTDNKKNMKIKILKIKEDSLIISDDYSAFTISKKNILQTEERKFAWDKTIGLPILIVAVLFGAAVYSLDNAIFLK